MTLKIDILYVAREEQRLLANSLYISLYVRLYNPIGAIEVLPVLLSPAGLGRSQF